MDPERRVMRILIVGDKEAERAILREAVTRLGHEWREAEDGDVGWLLYLDWHPHVVLSDYIMPGKNGQELCRAVRSQPHDHYTYFCVLSSLAERGHVLEGLRSGADDYLSKPVDVDELELRLLSAHRVRELHQRLAEQRTQLQELTQKLFAESRKDALTQVGNRLLFLDQMPGFLESVTKLDQPCSVALCDIDCFKQYNDIYGHMEGDKVLKVTAQKLSQGVAGQAHVYRFGGEEFLLVFPRLGLDQSQACLQQVCRGIEELNVVHVGNQPFARLTVTFGLCALNGDTPGDFERALKEADLALYEGKRSGKNRVQLFTSKAACP